MCVLLSIGRESMDILKEQSIQLWLNEFNKENTRRGYKSRIIKFLEFTNKTIADLQSMNIKELKRLVLDYQREASEKKVANNGILSIITAVRSYLISIDKPLMFRRGQLVNPEADTSSHTFSNGDLKILFEVGNTFEKALIATAVSEGWEISSFLNQDRELVKSKLENGKQNNEKFIYFNNTRKKTGVARFCVLNPLAIEWLDKYLVSRTDEDPRLFPITQDGVQKMFQRLANSSGLKTTGSLRFHNIRKWLMSGLSRAGFNVFQMKYIMGKSIGLSDATYLQTLETEIREKYEKIYDRYLNIYYQGNAETAKKQLEIEEKLTNTKNELSSLKSMVSELKKDNERWQTEHFNIKFALDTLVTKLNEKGIKIDVKAMVREEVERYEEEPED